MNMQRESISFEKEDFVSVEQIPSHWHSKVLPLILIKGRQFKTIGTCFVVNPTAAFIVTAKHNIDAIYSIEEDEVTIDVGAQGALHVFYLSEKRTEEGHLGNIVRVRQIHMRKEFDVAILTTQVPIPRGGKLEDSLFTCLALNFSLPEVGQRCMAIGYNKVDWRELPENTMEIIADLKCSRGVIEEIHFPQRDDSFVNYPAFRTSARMDSGMSGGPVFSEKGQVTGIVSTSYEGATPHLSYATHASCLLPILVSNDPDSQAAGKKYFYELVAEKKIPVAPGCPPIVVTKHPDAIKIEIGGGYGFVFPEAE